MYGSNYIFSKDFFSAWIIVAIIWLWGTMFVAGFFPIIDGRGQLVDIWRALRSGKRLQPNPEPQIESSGASDSGVEVSEGYPQKS
jgi:hypothetical protein